jgi:hypothetical protein
MSPIMRADVESDMRTILVALLPLLCTCTQGPIAHAQPTVRSASAESISLQPRDIAGLQRCPQTGTWDSYIAKEKTSDPADYPGDVAARDALRTFGLTQAYVSVYSDNRSECPFFPPAAPKGRLVYVFSFKFKATVTAEWLYGINLKDFKLGGLFLDQLPANGGTVNQGSVTGLGEASTVATITVANIKYFEADWSNKFFYVVVYGLNLSTADGTTAAQRINGRIG